MSENTEIKKYLDLEGLKVLWRKISDVYPRTEAVNALLKALEDKHDEEVADINDQLRELNASIGSTMDGDTIVRNEDNALQTNLVLVKNLESQTIQLVTRNKKTLISEFSYADFVKDGMLNSVSIVVVPEDETEQASGKAPGTYLKFVFNTDSGKEAIYLDATEFINVYEGDDYILVEGDNISFNTAKLEEYLDGSSAVITGIRTQISDAEKEIRRIDTSLQTLAADFTTLRGEFDELTGEFTVVKQTVSAFDTRIGAVEETLKTVPTTPISDEEINGLE